MHLRDELLRGLSPEQIEKVNSCNSAIEVLALAKDAGVELTHEQLEAVTGGNCYTDSKVPCPMCNSVDIAWVENSRTNVDEGTCRNCGFKFTA